MKTTVRQSCMTPFGVKDKLTGNTIPVPCGKCPVCLKRRVSGWSFRLIQEDKISTESHFITLTYDTQKVHITKNGYMGLNKRDLQLFFKRLRKAHEALGTSDKRRIKYFAVGEYGGRTMRPHYHIILFNCPIELIQPAWNMGNVHYGQVGGASVGYTLKYMCKPSKIPLHRNDDRDREFSLMSKNSVKAISPNKWCNGILQTSKTGCISIWKMVKKLQCQGTIRIKSIPNNKGIE